MNKEKDFTMAGLIAGFVFWIIFNVITASSFSCLDDKRNCGSTDLFLAAILGGGWLLPAYVVARLISE